MKSTLLGRAGIVLEAVCNADHPVAIKELASTVKMPLPTVSRLCADMTEIGLLEKTDYHHLIPGTALIRFGYRAKKLSPLIPILQQSLRDHIRTSGLNAVVFGFSRNQFFDIYSVEQNNVVPDPLRYTGAFLVMLAAASLQVEDAQKISLLRYPDMPVTEQIICDREFNSIKQKKVLIRVAPGKRWAITMPFIYNNTVCAMSCYGVGKDDRNVEQESFEISKVLSRIRTKLDRLGKGEE